MTRKELALAHDRDDMVTYLIYYSGCLQVVGYEEIGPRPSFPSGSRLAAIMLRSNKHFLNSPSSLVLDSLTGLCASNPNVKLDTVNKGMFIPNKLTLRLIGSYQVLSPLPSRD